MESLFFFDSQILLNRGILAEDENSFVEFLFSALI